MRLLNLTPLKRLTPVVVVAAFLAATSSNGHAQSVCGTGKQEPYEFSLVSGEKVKGLKLSKCQGSVITDMENDMNQLLTNCKWIAGAVGGTASGIAGAIFTANPAGGLVGFTIGAGLSTAACDAFIQPFKSNLAALKQKLTDCGEYGIQVESWRKGPTGLPEWQTYSCQKGYFGRFVINSPWREILTINDKYFTICNNACGGYYSETFAPNLKTGGMQINLTGTQGDWRSGSFVSSTGIAYSLSPL